MSSNDPPFRVKCFISYYEQGKYPIIAQNYLTIIPPSGSSPKNLKKSQKVVDIDNHFSYVILTEFTQHNGFKIPVYLMIQGRTKVEAINNFVNFYNIIPDGKIYLYKLDPGRGYLVGGSLSPKPIKVITFSYYQRECKKHYV